jgi:transposase
MPRNRAAAVDTKKKTVSASEQDPAARAAWREQAAEWVGEALVFVDETNTATNFARRYGRAPRGERARAQVPRNYKQRTSLIAALTPGGMGAAMTVPGAVDQAAFEAYIAQVLVPTLQPGQRVIMDNLSVHKSRRVEAAIAAADCTLTFLPTYSPDYNPIELAFAKFKEGLRATAARTQEALDQAISDGLDVIRGADAQAWYRHCGYPLARSP